MSDTDSKAYVLVAYDRDDSWWPAAVFDREEDADRVVAELDRRMGNTAPYERFVGLRIVPRNPTIEETSAGAIHRVSFEYDVDDGTIEIGYVTEPGDLVGDYFEAECDPFYFVTDYFGLNKVEDNESVTVLARDEDDAMAKALPIITAFVAAKVAKS